MTENEPRREPDAVPGVQSPESSAPGPISGAEPRPAEAPSGIRARIDAIAAAVERPTGIAKVLIAVTGAFTVLVVVLAAFARSDANALRISLETGESTSSPSALASMLIMPMLLASYFAYGMWMGRIRMNRAAIGHSVGPAALEWWGWLVPLVSLVLVPWGARRVTGRSAPLWALLGWWIVWQAAVAAYVMRAASTVASYDVESGTVARPEMLDASVTFTWAAAALTIVSWAFLVVFIRRVTARHVEA